MRRSCRRRETTLGPAGRRRYIYERLSERRAGLKVLFMSGYTDDKVSHRRVLDGSVPFLPKPFTVELLVRKVRETLDG
jgi:FixJ family two-component response regulator